MSNWKQAEDDILIKSKLYLNKSYGEIASILKGRTRNAVRHRWEAIREKINQEKQEPLQPNILLFDIETAPMKVYTWSLNTQYINPDNVIDDWYVICWSAKWLNSNEVLHGVLTSQEAINQDDKRILASIWELLDQADIVIGHNSQRFDHKKLNWRFLLHGFPPPLNYKVVDTIKVARKYFGSTSNKLDYLTKALRIGQKEETGGFELWKECMIGNKTSLDKMVHYCDNDVLILENIYLEMLPWITNHPNLALYNDTEIEMCPNCGSINIKPSNKLITTATSAYRQYRCLDCNHVGRTKQLVGTKEKRAVTFSN